MASPEPFSFARIAVASLVLASLTLAGCGKAPAPFVGGVSKINKNPLSALSEKQREEAFPSSVAWLTLADKAEQVAVVRFRSASLGFNDASKVGFPVLVRGKTQFKSNLYMGSDQLLYISDLGSNKEPHYWRVGRWGIAGLQGLPGDGSDVYVAFDPNISMAFAMLDAKENDGKPGFSMKLEVRTTPPQMTEPPLLAK